MFIYNIYIYIYKCARIICSWCESHKKRALNAVNLKGTHNMYFHRNTCCGSSSISYYRNWPRYGLRWSGWYCNPAQHELCRPSLGRAGRHNECCAGLQYQPRQRRPYKRSISILPRPQFYKKQGKLAFSTSCTAVRPHQRLRNDAWRRDS